MSDPAIRRGFLEKALAAASDWARFSDPKALAVLVVLGLGVGDLVSKARPLLLPEDDPAKNCDVVNVMGQSCAQVFATASYCLAALTAAIVVILVTAAVYPRLRLKKSEPPPQSLFYFEDIAKYDSGESYAEQVQELSPEKLEHEIAMQVYAVSKVASRKHRYASAAYLAVLMFLILWVGARVGLALA